MALKRPRRLDNLNNLRKYIAQVMARLDTPGMFDFFDEADTITVEKARAIGYLTGIMRTLIIDSELSARVDALESLLKDKNYAHT